MIDQLSLLPPIAFSDESRFVLGDDKKWVWVRKGEYTPSSMVTSVKFPQSVMIFAVIAIGYKSDILIVPGSIDSECYIKNCTEIGFIDALNSKYGDYQWIFMQDGARCHTSEKSMEFLEAECDVINDWPPNSPDLNPIEILWAILKKRVSFDNPKTQQELIASIKKSWSEIPQSLIDKLCSSFEGRLRVCLENDGDSISRFLSMTTELNDHLRNIRTNAKWTEDDDNLLLDMIWKHGHKWKVIAKFFPHHDFLACKNRWFSHLRKKQSAFLNSRLDRLFSQI